MAKFATCMPLDSPRVEPTKVPPGFRAEYSKNFYVGYLRDPIGNKLAIFCTVPQG